MKKVEITLTDSAYAMFRELAERNAARGGLPWTPEVLIRVLAELAAEKELAGMAGKERRTGES